MMNHVAEHKFQLMSGIKIGSKLFISIVPFGLGLLAITAGIGLAVDILLKEVMGQMVMTMVFAIMTGALLIKVKCKMLNKPDTLKDVIRELKHRLVSLLTGGVILILMSLSIKFYLMLVIPWHVMFDALDILYAILFMFIYHGIIIGNDVAIEAVSNSFEAYLENKLKVILMGLFIIAWSVILLITLVQGYMMLYVALKYLVTPTLAGYLICVNAANYVQMIEEEPFS